MAMLITLDEFLGKRRPMSRAKACDRCGKLYAVDRDHSKGGYPIRIKYGIDYGKHTDYFTEDLCLECTNAFHAFMDMREPIKITRTDNIDHNEEEN